MGNCLGIGGDTIVHFTGEIDMLRTERGKDLIDELKAFIGGTVLDQDLDDTRCSVLGRAGMELGWVRRPTRGCPFGLTLGPCSEWHDTISTSCGRCFSNAASSGALQDV